MNVWAKYYNILSFESYISQETLINWHPSNYMASQVVLVVKNPPANVGDARDADSIPGLGKSPGVGSGNPLQYSCLQNSMDREAWQATAHGVAKSQTRLSNWALSNYTLAYMPCLLWVCFKRHICYHYVNKIRFLNLKISVLWEDLGELPEKAMAPHSSTLTWKIPWMEEPGRLQFMGLLRVRHDWATSLSLFTFMH